MNKEDLIFQAKNQIKMGLDFIQNKRAIYRERLKFYIDQDKEEGKIGINTIYSIINTNIAVKLADEPTVLFRARSFGDEEYCENLTKLASYDYEEMGLKQKDYARFWDTSFFGFAIKSKGGWDEVRQCPLIIQRDPLTRIPDPYSDFMTLPRFHYFETEILKSDMTKERGFIEDIVQELTNEEDQEIKSNKNYRNTSGGFSNVQEDISKDFYISVYDGYTYFEGKLYALTLTLSGELVRLEEIKPVRKEEKKSGFIDIRTQVEVEYYSPLRGNCTGVSLVDLIIDKQVANSQLMNLRLIDAKFSTFGQTNLVNTDIVQNTGDLTKPSINTKWIKVNAGNQSLSNAIYPVPRQNIMQDSYNVTNEILRQIYLDTGFSENQLGVPEKNITLGQSQQVQTNANLKLSLGITIQNWGESDFWNYIWLRSYEEYFGKAEKKVIRVSNGFGVNVIEVRKDDFIGGGNPDIIIDSKKKIELENEKIKVNFLSMLPYFTQDQSKPNIVKNIALRYALKLQGLNKELINILTYDPVEEKAKMIVHKINNNDMSASIIDNLNEDHLTFMIIFESAIDNETKFQAIQSRRNAYILSGQINKQTQVAEGGMINQTQAMNTSNALKM